MPKYHICFACYLPGEPGCGCPDNDFYAEHEFEGSPVAAVRKAKKLSWEKYMGDFKWWIEKKEDAAAEREMWQNKFKGAERLDYHPVEETPSIMGKPSYTSRRIPAQDTPSGKLSPGRVHVNFDAYNGDELVRSGDGLPGTSSRPHLVEASIFSVERMVYCLCLALGKDVTHIVRQDKLKCVVDVSLEVDVYEFRADEKLVAKYMREVKEREIEEALEFHELCSRLREKGTTV